MKFREIFIAFTLAVITAAALQYFLGRYTSSDTGEIARSGQRFSAPKSTDMQMYKPLNLEIDFVDIKSTKQPVVTTLKTDHALYEFSTDGAALRRLEFTRNYGGKEQSFSTVFPPAATDREKSCFLVALDQQTPYVFDLIDQQETEQMYTLSYKASINGGALFKNFSVFKHEHRIDLELALQVAPGAAAQQARIFIPAPLVPELAGEDAVTGLANDDRNKILILPRDAQTASSYWSRPTLFGAQDRYFAHAMVSDQQQFTQRGYFKAVDIEGWFAILEGPQVTTDSSWKLTFYMGPKEDHAINQVDSRLEQTLNYGFFSFISKPLSKLMLRALDLIYGVVHNYGWAIIILTILLKLLLLPFTWRGEQSMKLRLEYQKKLAYIESKYKHDKETLAHERAELVRKYGMPGMASCLPLLLQLPIFWALSIILANSIELYKAPFLWIPDLSARDPYYVLPILVAIGMILHSPAVSDAKQRISSIGMALLIAALISSFSSGLALFTVVSTFLGVAQAQLMKVMKHD